MKRILIMAGGTGGHIFPALAVAQALHHSGVDVHWLGSRGGLEERLVPEQFSMSYVAIKAFRGTGLLKKLLMPWRLVRAIVKSYRIIRRLQPDVVLGMGGYASAPGGLAAWLMNKPLVVHEQNAAAGLTNRLLAKIATKVCCAFPNAFQNNVKALVVGNPLRANITQSNGQASDNRDDAKSTHNILVVGGSLGAQVLNEIVPSSFATLAKNSTKTSARRLYFLNVILLSRN